MAEDTKRFSNIPLNCMVCIYFKNISIVICTGIFPSTFSATGTQ